MNNINISDLINKIKINKQDNNTLFKEKEQLKKNIENLQLKIDRLYEDRYNNIISIDTYTRLSFKI